MTIKHQWSFNDYVRAKTAFQNTIDGTHYGNVKTTLSQNVTFYVRSDGSDSNNGLTNTAGGAFASIQKAADVVQGLNCDGNNFTVYIGAGTFNQSYWRAPDNLHYGYIRPAGVSTIIFDEQPFNFSGNFGQFGVYFYGGMYCKCTAGGIPAFVVANGAKVHIQNGFTLTSRLQPNQYLFNVKGAGSFLRIQSGVHLPMYAVTGNTHGVFQIGNGGSANVLPIMSIATGSFNSAQYFARVYYDSYLRWHLGGGSSGSFTGKKFKVGLGSSINTYGAYSLPGNAAGIGYNGGIYA